MSARIETHGLKVDKVLFDFVEEKVLPGTGVASEAFWAGMANLAHEFGPENRRLLDTRTKMQGQIDAWHKARKGKEINQVEYIAFLKEIGYLVPEGPDFAVETQGVDPEMAAVAGPQLVVPVTNARFALNAANARWGSLYDALYGTDAMGDLPPAGGYNAERGARVIAWGRAHLDKVAPLANGSWADISALSITGSNLTPALKDASQFAGHTGEAGKDLRVLLRANDLLIELVVDPSHPIGASDKAKIADIRLESALSTIMDCEDSVACVDAADKVVAYANWLGLMKGDLEETFEKGGKPMTRRMASDRTYTAPDGSTFSVKGRSLMLVRNVGHLMTNPAILDRDGLEIGEGLMDALITAAIAMHDLKKTSGNRNSLHGSVYVVKPKMHGPEEVGFAVRIFDHVEKVLGLPANTVKLGIMDEERRTSANLKECIRVAKSRVAFINTGFLDRTGDEIHTSMEAGPMLPKGEMKGTDWIKSYEERNVDIGLACGLQGKAQIGKGMWARPDDMADMLKAKIGHPKAGANTAWVPSPTAATLHATHYHHVNVSEVQNQLRSRDHASQNALLTPPVMIGRNLSDEDVTRELDNACQSILGYVVRWVDQGIGCSKVPDIDDVALMEDRATLRISSQYLANWIEHGICTVDQVEAAFRRMAPKVDAQNAGDPAYKPMAPSFDGEAFNAARALVLEGISQPSGYTEPLLYKARLRVKAAAK